MKHRTVLFAITMDEGGILSADQIGTIELASLDSLTVELVREWLSIHVANAKVGIDPAGTVAA